MNLVPGYYLKTSGAMPATLVARKVSADSVKVQVINSETEMATSGYSVSFSIEDADGNPPGLNSPLLSLSAAGGQWSTAIEAHTSNDSPYYATAWIKGGEQEGVQKWKLVVRILDGHPPFHKMETILSVQTSLDTEVDNLVIVSGDNQVVQLGVTGKHYTALVVKATQVGAPVDGAKVTWEVKDTRGSSGTTIPPDPVITAGGGLASATPVAGSKQGLLTVTATCNGHKAIFHLTVLPARADLTLIPNIIPAVQPAIATTFQPARVRLITRSNDNEFWPDIPCRFQQAIPVTPDMEVTDTPETGTSVVSNPQGWLPTFRVRFSKAPPKGTKGEVSYQAYLPGNDTSPVTVTITLNVAS